MNNSQIVADGIKNVLNNHKSSIVIGLTGRTGSGCTTAAKILTTKSFEKLNLPSLNVPPNNHEDRKDRIVYMWGKEHWKPFRYLSVTTILLTLAVKDGTENLKKLITSIDPNFDSDGVITFLNENSALIEKANIALDQKI